MEHLVDDNHLQTVVKYAQKVVNDYMTTHYPLLTPDIITVEKALVMPG